MGALFVGKVDEIGVVNCKFLRKLLGVLLGKGVFEDTRNLCKFVGMDLLLGELLEGADWSRDE